MSRKKLILASFLGNIQVFNSKKAHHDMMSKNFDPYIRSQSVLKLPEQTFLHLK